jgi:hypothetical protein
MQVPDKLYTVQEALPLMGMRLTRFYALVGAGEIATINNGRRTLIAESEILRFRATLPVMGRREQPASDQPSAA